MTSSLDKLSSKMHQGYFKNHEPKQYYGFEKSIFHPIDRKKGSKRPMLTQEEKLDIVH